MKNIKHFLLILSGIILLGACQKELSFEGGNTISGQASGSLKDTLNNCLSNTVQGKYIQDSTLTDSNFVSVQAIITAPGYYLIYTDTKNGFSFRDSGYATTPGLQTFKLKGKGKPLAAGTSDFSIIFGTSVCSFSVVTTVAVSGPAAVFTLGGSPGSCTGATLRGAYLTGVALTAANTVDITVTVTTPGSFSITTGTAGGMTFSGTGNFAAAGSQTVTLKGGGTPAAAGTYTIPITLAGSSCNFSITVAPNTPAVYSIGTLAGACTGTTIQGAYRVGTAVTAANTATLTVNVATPGSYSIGAIGAGVNFLGTGSFTTTGSQTIVLQATGTPVTAGNNTFNVSGGGNSCSFTVSVSAASGPGTINQADTAWSFNQGTTFFKGRFDSAYTATIPGIGFGLQLQGPSTNVVGDTFQLVIIFPGTTIQTGTYSSSLNSAFYFYNAAADIYAADPTTAPAVTTITITSYDAASKVIQGTFSGTAENSLGIPVPITGGRFKALMN